MIDHIPCSFCGDAILLHHLTRKFYTKYNPIKNFCSQACFESLSGTAQCGCFLKNLIKTDSLKYGIRWLCLKCMEFNLSLPVQSEEHPQKSQSAYSQLHAPESPPLQEPPPEVRPPQEELKVVESNPIEP